MYFKKKWKKLRQVWNAASVGWCCYCWFYKIAPALLYYCLQFVLFMYVCTFVFFFFALLRRLLQRYHVSSQYKLFKFPLICRFCFAILLCFFKFTYSTYLFLLYLFILLFLFLIFFIQFKLKSRKKTIPIKLSITSSP